MNSPFFTFLHERHRIYLRRSEGLPKPWTNDPILQQYRFCNVYRELDTVTIWIRKNIREPYALHPNLWFMLCVARAINWPPTLAECLNPKWDARLFQMQLNARQARGEKVYTGAYMLRSSGGGHGAKNKYVAHELLDPVWRAGYPAELNTLQTVSSWLRSFHGWGGFMAYEVVSDLRHTRYLHDASDINTWAHAGPGALRGLNRIHGRPVKLHLQEKQALFEMQELLAQSRDEWGLAAPAFEMREIEHGLCEFDKYERVRLGEGRPRSIYPGV